jgi:hypothetical protein
MHTVMMRRGASHWLVALLLCAAPVHVHTQVIAPSLDSDHYGDLVRAETTTPTPGGELPTATHAARRSDFHTGQRP